MSIILVPFAIVIVIVLLAVFVKPKKLKAGKKYTALHSND